MNTSIKLIAIICIILNHTLTAYKITSLQETLQKNSAIQYLKIHEEVPFNMPPFEIANLMPHQGIFKELFILNIPNGIVKGLHGYILVNDGFIQELIWGELDNLHNLFANAQQINPYELLQIPGSIAVIAQLDPKVYGHFILEILGRLAILEMGNINYDFLYIPYEIAPFIKEIFDLWGVDTSKIISPNNNNFAIQAEHLIVPSFNISTDKGYRHGGNFHHPVVIKYIREKLLHAALQKNISANKFSKRIFISRGDSPNGRKIFNENEVFELFKNKGFEKYILNNLSIAEQIILFHNAEIIVCENGSGLTNILFCKPNTQIIEIFQNFIAMDFWQLAYICDLQYTQINTLLGQDANFYSNWHSDFNKFYSFSSQPNIPLDQIKELLKRW